MARARPWPQRINLIYDKRDGIFSVCIDEWETQLLDQTNWIQIAKHVLRLLGPLRRSLSGNLTKQGLYLADLDTLNSKLTTEMLT